MPKMFSKGRGKGRVDAGVFDHSGLLRCPRCGEKVGEPHEFIILTGGSMLMKGDSSVDLPKGKRLDASLELIAHGAHSEGIRRKLPRDVFIAATCAKGNNQFESYFCSIDCLRKSLSLMADQFEALVMEQARKQVIQREHGEHTGHEQFKVEEE